MARTARNAMESSFYLLKQAGYKLGTILKKINPWVVFWVFVGLAVFAAFLAVLSIPFIILSGIVSFLKDLDRDSYYEVALVLGALGLLVAYIVAHYKAGIITLSSQSLAHRRNLLFTFILTILIEKFNFDVLTFFRAFGNKVIQGSSCPPCPPESLLSIEDSKGIIGAFAVFFFIEYIYNFVSDLIKSVNSTDLKNNSPFIFRFVFRDIWLFVVGNFRFIFDLVIPFIVVVVVVSTYLEQAEKFAELVHDFTIVSLNDVAKSQGWDSTLEEWKIVVLDVYHRLEIITINAFDWIKENIVDRVSKKT